MQQKQANLVCATLLELVDLTAARHGFRICTAFSTAFKVRLSLWLYTGRNCRQTPSAWTTKETSGSGQSDGWKGDGSCLACFTCSSLPKPGGKRRSKPLAEELGYRCPVSPAKIAVRMRPQMGTGPSTSQGSCRNRRHIGYACRLARSQACNRARTWCQVLSGMSAKANWIRRSRHTSVAVNRPGIASRRPGSQTVCLNLSLNAASSAEVKDGTNLASKILGSIAISATTQGIWKPLPMKEFCAWVRFTSFPQAGATSAGGKHIIWQRSAGDGWRHCFPCHRSECSSYAPGGKRR